jgi:uncharacterized protein (TIGR03437 family)
VIAINEDGTMNSADHPAPRGSVISFFATGLGQTDPPLNDGQIAPGAAPATLGTSVDFFKGRYDYAVPAEVLYSGAAPGQVAGVYQLNVRIPLDAAIGHSQLRLNVSAIGGVWLQ